MIKRTNERKTHSRTRFSAKCVSCWKCVCVYVSFFSLFERARNWWMSKRNMSLTVCMVYALKITRAPITASNARAEEEKNKRTLFEDKPLQTQKPITATITNEFWTIFLKCSFFVYVWLIICAQAFALLDFSTMFFCSLSFGFSFAVTSLNVSNVIALHSARLWSSMHTWCWT